MIEVNDLHKSFGKVKVLNGIHLEYHPGKIYGLVGENGAGKTTLFNCIMYKPQNKMFHFCKTFCSKITLVNTIQNVILNTI